MVLTFIYIMFLVVIKLSKNVVCSSLDSSNLVRNFDLVWRQADEQKVMVTKGFVSMLVTIRLKRVNSSTMFKTVDGR